MGSEASQPPTAPITGPRPDARSLLGERPSTTDPVARALVRAHVGGALFERDADPVEIGRFQLLERVGRGGMGTVYAAYDPDLDRRVALKLVPTADGASRARLLAEARALARLSHPHVVPIHDVELVDDWVCIVMEFVRGQTLRAYCSDRGRSQRDVLRVYRQAGEGLHAAHRAGLLHGDFKPDNAIVGTDGRVKVLDFGLARPVRQALSDCPQGTPGYMAPEVHSATGVATPAIDQYSFCASLREGLGEPVPRWLSPALERGMSADPTARFASMADLLRLLARDPGAIRSRRWLMTGLTVGTAALAMGAFAAGRQVDLACEDSAEQIASVWNRSSRRLVGNTLQRAGAYGVSIQGRLFDQIDRYVDSWKRSRRASCESHRRAVQSSALFDRRMACLDSSHQALDTLIDLLSRPGGAPLPDALVALAALPPIERCNDASALLAAVAPAPPALTAQVAGLDGQLARARVLLAAGRAEPARAASAAAVSGARKIGYPPLLARALLTLGHAEMRSHPRERAVPTLREATVAALAAGDDLAAVEAYARRLWAEGTTAGPEEDRSTFEGIALMEAMARRHPQGAFVRALLHSNAASVERHKGRAEAAARALERALLAAQEVPSPRPVELVNIRTVLALSLTDAARRARLLDEVAAERTASLGADHPLTLDARIRAAALTEDPAAAARALPPLCSRQQQLHPDHGSRIADCWFEVGWLAYARRDLEQTAQALQAALMVPGLERTQAAIIRGYLELARSEMAVASRAFGEALSDLPPGKEAPWWKRLQAADAQLGRALALRARGHRRRAQEAFGAAEALLAPLAREQPLPPIQRRLAQTRAERAGL
jgi:serine/threonine protein kinase